MAKKIFEGFTPQIKAIQTGKATLSVYPTPLWGVGNSLEFLRDDSSLKIRIHNFESGRGNSQADPVFNVDRDSLEELFLVAEDKLRPQGMTDAPYEYGAQKIYANSLQNSGEFAGMYRSRKIRIKYESLRNGTPARYPWSISITNGYAAGKPGANPGSFMEVGGTYRPQYEGVFYLSKRDFHTLTKRAVSFFDNIELLAQMGLIPGVPGYRERAEKIDQYRSKGEYFGDAQASYGYSPQVQPEAPQPVQQAETAQAVQKQEAMLVVASGFIEEAGHMKASCKVDGVEGKLFPVYFKGPLSTGLLESYRTQIPVKVSAYKEISSGRIIAEEIS